jgi:glutamine amidotransferase
VKKLITIIDYGAGNLHSVKKAFERIGFETELASDPETARAASHIVLPGVGSFGDAMKNMTASGMAGAVRDAIKADKRFLGICLGMQLLFDGSDEFAPGEEKFGRGLSVFPGRIVRLPESVISPHMGWNSVCGNDDVIFGGEREKYVYFVHSYYCPVTDAISAFTAAECEYGGRFAAAVRRGACFGVQFHPEKSGGAGLDILKRFGELN